MARPTNKEKEDRKILLKYFKRDSEIYTNFEKVTQNQSKERMIYTLLEACSIRNTCNIIGGICCTFNNNPNNNGFDNWEEEILYQELMDIDETKHDYYSSILAHSQQLSDEEKHKKDYRAYQMVDEVVLVELFGEKRVKEFDNRGYPYYLLPLLRKLTDHENEKLKKYIAKNQFGTNTIIKREYANRMKLMENKHINLLVELDFTKPVEEIQEYVAYLHEEYKNNKILDIFDYLDIKRNHPQLSDHDIYITNGHKPFNAVLADKLFIYDSFKNGLNFIDIRNEIDEYTKKFSTDKIRRTTLKNYLHFMVDFIDNENFIDFRDGYY